MAQILQFTGQRQSSPLMGVPNVDDALILSIKAGTTHLPPVLGANPPSREPRHLRVVRPAVNISTLIRLKP